VCHRLRNREIPKMLPSQKFAFPCRDAGPDGRLILLLLQGIWKRRSNKSNGRPPQIKLTGAYLSFRNSYDPSLDGTYVVSGRQQDL
jgi:hypothetical protein